MLPVRNLYKEEDLGKMESDCILLAALSLQISLQVPSANIHKPENHLLDNLMRMQGWCTRYAV